MMKSLMFLSGAAAGFAVASGLTDDQRRSVRERVTRVSSGEHSQRLVDAVSTTKDSVADVAVTAVETAADKVTAAAAKAESAVGTHHAGTHPVANVA